MQVYWETEDILQSRNVAREMGYPEISKREIVNPFTRGNIWAKDPYFFSLPYVYFLGALLAKIFTLALLSSQPVRPYILRFPHYNTFVVIIRYPFSPPPPKKS